MVEGRSIVRGAELNDGSLLLDEGDGVENDGALNSRPLEDGGLTIDGEERSDGVNEGEGVDDRGENDGLEDRGMLKLGALNDRLDRGALKSGALKDRLERGALKFGPLDRELNDGMDREEPKEGEPPDE